MKIWSDAEILRLKAHLLDGMSTSQAGRALGRTRNSVIGIISRHPALRSFYTPKRTVSLPSQSPTKWDESRARQMLESGDTLQNIGKHFGLTGTRVKALLDPEYAERRRAQARVAKANYVKRNGDGIKLRGYVRAAEQDAEAYRQFANFPRDTRSLTGRLAGDPLPGRSALDMRKQQETRI